MFGCLAEAGKKKKKKTEFPELPQPKSGASQDPRFVGQFYFRSHRNIKKNLGRCHCKKRAAWANTDRDLSF